MSKDNLTELQRATLAERNFRERDDLQRHLKQNINALGDDLLVIAEEFSQWQDSRRRIDLLAIDRDASLVVIELKRTDDGGHMELQAIRYAAMVSTLTYSQALEAYAEVHAVDLESAENAILEFLGVPEPPESFGTNVRIVLVSPDFAKELTTAVLWLNRNGLDIRCVRLRPYALEQRTLLEIEQIIPIREAGYYQTRLKRKETEAREAAVESTIDFTRYDLSVDGHLSPHLWKRGLIRQVIAAAAQAGLTLEQLFGVFTERKFLVAPGHVRGEEFLRAAEKTRETSGYVFRPGRFFMEDDDLIEIMDYTIAVSTQWGRHSLPQLDELIALIPSAKIAYRRSGEANT